MRIMLTFCTIVVLSGCGTATGLLDGTSTVLEGVATDLRSASGAMR